MRRYTAITLAILLFETPPGHAIDLVVPPIQTESGIFKKIQAELDLHDARQVNPVQLESS